MASSMHIPGGTYYQYDEDTDSGHINALTPYQAIPLYLLDDDVLSQVKYRANSADIGGELFIPDDYVTSHIVWVLFHSDITPLLHDSMGYQEWKDFIFNHDSILPINLQVGNHKDNKVAYQEGESNINARLLCDALNLHRDNPAEQNINALDLSVKMPLFNREKYIQGLTEQGNVHVNDLKPMLAVDDKSMGWWSVFQQGQRMIQLGFYGGQINGTNKTRLYQIQYTQHMYGSIKTYMDADKVTKQDYTNTVDIYCYNGRVEFIDIANTKGLLLQWMGQAFTQTVLADIDSYEETLDDYLDDDSDSDDDVSVFDNNSTNQSLDVGSDSEPNRIDSLALTYILGNLIWPKYLTSNPILSYASFLVYLAGCLLAPGIWLANWVGSDQNDFTIQQSHVLWMSLVLFASFASVFRIETVAQKFVDVNLASKARTEFLIHRRQLKTANYMSWGLRLLILAGCGLILGPVVSTSVSGNVFGLAIILMGLSWINLTVVLYRRLVDFSFDDGLVSLIKLMAPVVGVMLVSYFVMNLIVTIVFNA